MQAYMLDQNTIEIHGQDTFLSDASSLYLRDSKNRCFFGDIIVQKDASSPILMKVSQSLCIGENYEVLHATGYSCFVSYRKLVKHPLFDETFAYDGEDLGCHICGNMTTFALWAPTAHQVKVEIQELDHSETYEMKRSERGVFRYTCQKNLEGATYVYLVCVSGTWKPCIDPYAFACTTNSKRCCIVDPTKWQVEDVFMPKCSSCDAILYEMSIRDFTAQCQGMLKHPSTFLGTIEENAYTKQEKIGFSYLKELGITHVQLLPICDFKGVEDRYPQKYYNWGYDVFHFFALEKSYFVEKDDVGKAYQELQKMIQTFHKHQLRVVLDVVFNHVFDRNHHFLQMIVEDYYLQSDSIGSYSNASGCGCDLDSTRFMCRKLIVDACVYLCRYFHIDGLRFDLMGILDVETLLQIQTKCRAIREDFMVYGEGWNMPSLLAEEKRASMVQGMQLPQVAFFEDGFRDALKGSIFHALAKGYCAGNKDYLEAVKWGLQGRSTHPELGFLAPTQIIHYTECHDNWTCFDKLCLSCQGETQTILYKRHVMCLAMVLLAQGIPFLHSGQEFARTKQGIANTYRESDAINQIDYARKKQFSTMVETTKFLLALRRNHACFRYTTPAEIACHVQVEDIEKEAIVYRVSDADQCFYVFFHPGDRTLLYQLPETCTMLFYHEPVERQLVQEITIEPYSTIILQSLMPE